MKRHLLAAAVGLSFLAGLTARQLSGARPAPATAAATAQEARGDSEVGAAWEYCAVTKAQYAGSVRANQYWIVYFRVGKDPEVVDVTAGPTGNAQARAIARVGEEGWELVGEASLDTRPGLPTSPRDNPPALLFKRLKR